MNESSIKYFSYLVTTHNPFAQAILRGNDQFPNIRGTVNFYNAKPCILVVAEVFNLPYKFSKVASEQYGPFYGFHLHEGTQCGSGAGNDPFAASGGHYNPAKVEHPYHAGDFPSLLGNEQGYAYSSFLTCRLQPEEIIGKTVIVHQHPDDFRSQPSGESGMKIACGVVTRNVRAIN